VTPKEQKVLTSVLQANRRALALLDKRIEELSKTNSLLSEEWDAEKYQPFFYVAEGADGQSGIPFRQQNGGENPAFGYVRVQPDSAFVLSSVSVCLTTIVDSTRVVADPFSGLGLRFYDESSSRWISFTNQNNEPQQKAKFPSAAFSALRSFNEGGFALPTECTFPRSAVVRVEVYNEAGLPDFVTGILIQPRNYRAQVVFYGYKVYGG
jgi:hypothetical protein